MKKSFSVAIFLLLVLSACKKYEDGPAMSLHTKLQRIGNVWYMHNVYENGVDKSSDYMYAFYGYRITIKRDFTYQLNYRYLNIVDVEETGTWVWNSDKTHVIFTKTNSSTSTDWKILRLREKELWAEYTDYSTNPSKTIEVHLVP